MKGQYEQHNNVVSISLIYCIAELESIIWAANGPPLEIKWSQVITQRLHFSGLFVKLHGVINNHTYYNKNIQASNKPRQKLSIISM